MNRKQRRRTAKAPTPARNQSALSDELRRELDSAIALYRAQRLAEAEAACGRVLRARPNHPVALNLLGNILGEAGRLDDAIESFRKAVESKPDYAEAHSDLGNALCARGDLPAAIQSYRRALRLNPDYAVAHYNLGLALQREDKLRDAVASYQRALKIRPAYPNAENNLGGVLRTLGLLDEAAAAFRRAIALVPDFAATYCNLGAVLRAQGELDDAVAACRKAVEIDPAFSMAYFNLGAALQASGALEEAIASYRRAVAVRPDYVEAHCMLGVALEEQGDVKESLVHLRQALEIDPDYAAARNNIGIANKFHGRPDGAIVDCRRKCEATPDDAVAQLDLGLVLWEKGLAGEAADAIRAAIRIAPENAHAHYALGLAHKTLGARDEALECVRRALALDPGDVHALAAEASILAETAQRAPARGAKRVAIHMHQKFHYGILRQVFDAVAAHHDALLTPHVSAVVDFDPDVVVIAESHAALLRSRLPRAVVVWVRHGLISKNTTCYAARVSDVACLTSEASRDWYVKHGGQPRREFWITGYVQMDPLFRGDPLPTGLTLPSGRKTVLYAPTWNADLSSAPLLGDRLVELIRGRRDDVSIVIKPHPVIAEHHPQWLVTWRALAAADRDVHLVEDRTANVMAYLKIADLLVTDASSVIFEYLAVDRPMILISNPARFASSHFDPRGIEWRWRDIGEELDDVEDLPAAVDRGLGDPRLGADRRARYRKELFGDLTDGRAAERIAEHITALEL